MGITHKWTGSILTITSDSGTSSMDLQGPKGNKGCRGPQGRAGCIVKPDGTIDMSGYATETYADEKLEEVATNGVNLDEYYTKEQIIALLEGIDTDVDLTGYATEIYVDGKVNDLQRNVLNTHYTKSEVKALLDNIDVDVDLSSYYTKTETDSAISEAVDNIPAPDLTGYATQNFVTTKIAAAQLEGAGVDVSGFATIDYVDDAMSNIKSIGRAGTGESAEMFNGATTASGSYAHAEGQATKVTGHSGSHAEGRSTTASGITSHAEGYFSEAKGHYSHAEGYYTIAGSDKQHVQGSYNIEDNAERYLHIVGNGKYATNRSNAFTLDWDGNAWFKGKVYVGGTSMDDAVELGAGGGSGGDLSGYYTKTETDAKILELIRANMPTSGDEVSY